MTNLNCVLYTQLKSVIAEIGTNETTGHQPKRITYTQVIRLMVKAKLTIRKFNNPIFIILLYYI